MSIKGASRVNSSGSEVDNAPFTRYVSVAGAKGVFGDGSLALGPDWDGLA